MNWKISSNERRTFIGSPYGFRIELQSNVDTIDGTPALAKIEEIDLVVKEGDVEKDLSQLFNKQMNQIHSVKGGAATIKKAVMSGILTSKKTDPNGVFIVREND
ncbi:hypothetical protein [Bacillus sp. BHET2]|uniref:hypothetical protein n=1 Tax=Bacillus sp. BHET2 TaxID=2583818 RepID=UPI001F0DFE40|nr:hypothetical protein [Bacillus sp. BHET2]